MKHRLKGLLALVLSLVMVFALATNAWAAVRIGGQDISENTYWTYSDNAWSVGNDQSYNVHLSNNTLTLNEFVYNGNSNIYSDGNLTLNLIGNNAVTYGESGAAAVHVTGNLTIKGDNGSSLTVSGTYSITDGIHADNVTIESGTVTATGGEAGISANNNVVITGGTVTATGDEAGIHSDKTITITGGTVTATGDEGRGIYTKEGNVTISGGTVKATGKTHGIFAYNDGHSGGMKVAISGGSVEAYATNDTGSIGIYAPGYDGEIAISGDNTQVTVGCATGLKASTVNILENSTVNITTNATTFTDGKTIDCTNLYFDADTSKLGTWYQWSENGGSVNISSNTNQLTVDEAKGVQTLTIGKISTGGPGNTNPYPPIIYNPTPTPEPEVTAPNTFDGGIASAVVVTILSATGGAWLAKKKD